jgi:hypothetical protein
MRPRKIFANHYFWKWTDRCRYLLAAYSWSLFNFIFFQSIKKFILYYSKRKPILIFYQKEKKLTWIKPSDEICILTNDNEFESILRLEDISIQSIQPLSKNTPHYKCIQLEVSENGQGASVGIASCR